MKGRGQLLYLNLVYLLFEFPSFSQSISQLNALILESAIRYNYKSFLIKNYWLPLLLLIEGEQSYLYELKQHIYIYIYSVI